jgi:uroporphyrin-3 C-methyltransferase
MNTDTSMTESPAPVGAKDRGKRAGLAWLALLIALGSLCASGWLWWQNTRATRTEAMQVSAELQRQGQQLAELDTRSARLGSQLADVAAADPGQRLEVIERQLGDLQTASSQWKSFQDESAAWTRSIQAALENNQTRLAGAEARLATLSARSMSSSAELDLDEIDYLLRLAQERLQLFADAKTADRALELADAHIAAFDNPMYAGLRRELSRARQELALLNPPDARVLNQKLDTLQGALASMPFRGEKSTGEPLEEATEPGWWARIRAAFSGLVTVRRSAEDDSGTPVLADQEVVRQGSWLQLELARYAVIRRDQQAYDAALERFSGNLQRWFEPSSQGWQQAMNLLPELQSVDIAPTMPDISAPWLALRALRDSGISAPLPAMPVPGPGSQPDPASGSEPAAESSAGETAE